MSKEKENNTVSDGALEGVNGGCYDFGHTATGKWSQYPTSTYGPCPACGNPESFVKDKTVPHRYLRCAKCNNQWFKD